MAQPETNEVLIAILQMLKDQAIYLQRQRAWMTAIGDTLVRSDLGPTLKAQPFFDLRPRQDEQIMSDALERIDALVQQLKA